MLSSLHEGIPRALVEALAMGKRVVATRVGGIREVLGKDGLGILIEPKNPAQLGEACLTLLNDCNEAFKLIRREYIIRKFSSEVISQNIIKLYQALAGLRH